jgi:hypothetical protein
MNFAPLRSLNSQVVGSIVFHDVARPGIIFESGSICTSLSKMCSAMLLFGNRLKKVRIDRRHVGRDGDRSSWPAAGAAAPSAAAHSSAVGEATKRRGSA